MTSSERFHIASVEFALFLSYIWITRTSFTLSSVINLTQTEQNYIIKFSRMIQAQTHQKKLNWKSWKKGTKSTHV